MGGSAAAVEEGIASAIAGVDADTVTATLSVRGSHRLGGHAAAGIVDVAAVIQAEHATAASTIQTAAAAVSTENMEIVLNDAFAGMNITVEVVSMTCEQGAALAGPSPTEPSDYSGAIKPVVASKMVAGLVLVVASRMHIKC